MRLTLGPDTTGLWAEFARQTQARMARAVTLTMQDVAQDVKTGVRSAIASGGLSRKHQNAFRTKVFPRQGDSMSAAVWGASNIDYENIFQRGGTIRPVSRRWLWVPTKQAPPKIGGKHTTIKSYLQSVGPLQFIKRPGHPPVMVAKVTRRMSSTKGFSVSSLRRGSAAHAQGKKTQLVPIFVGLTSVTIRRRFNVDPVYEAARSSLPSKYASHMEALSG